MKKTIAITALFLICSVLFLSCKKQDSVANLKQTTKSKVVAKAETATFNIKGMTCAMGCAKTIENKLAGLEGVQKVTVDFEKETATIQYDAQVQNTDVIVKTVEAVADGKTYQVSNLKSSTTKA
jgi:periplasmic mercuric ion binding protein